MNKRQPIFAVCAVIAIVLTMVVGCSPNFHKADADKEVYKIIDAKWQNNFGQKANYVISDANTIATPNDVNVAKVPVFEEPLTLAQAVAIATKYNRDYQFQKENLYLQALTLTGERYKYALKWFGTVDYEYTKNGSSPEDRTIKSEVSASKTFLTPDGILLNTSLAFDWAKFLTGDPRTTLSGVLSGTLDIPLLGNGGGKAAWEELTQAERNVLYEIRTFNRYRQTFVINTISAYYGVLQNKDGVTNAKNNWNSSVEYRKQAEMEAKTGRTAPYEVDQARQRELSAYDSYIITLQLYEQSLDSFKIMLSLPVNTPLELDQNELRALQNYGTTKLQFSIDDTIKTALRCRLDLANSADAVDDAQRTVKLAAEGLGPQLDLTGSANVNSQGNAHIDNFQFHKGTYNWGLSANLPFDRKNQRNAYRQALITLERQQRAYSQSVDSVVQSVRQDYRQLMATAEEFVTQEKSLAIAEERVKNMPLLLKSGRAKTTDLLDAQDALLLAQNNLTSSLVGHTIAKLTFYSDVGILQVKPDGMWTQSAIVSKDQANEREQGKQSSKDNL